MVSHSSEATPGTTALRALFDAEVLAAGIPVPDADREHLFVMWLDHLPLRESLRAADLALEAEPSFIEKPAQPSGGISPTSTSGGAS